VAAESQVQEPIQPIPLKIALNSSAKVALGKKLFQDVRLSSNNQVSCMSCHHLNAGGADSVAQSVGVNGVVGEINSPTIFNVQFNFRFNWDGEFESLADHLTALLPNPQTMASSWDVLVQKLQQIPDYAQTFAKIYPEELTQATLTDAIVSYESSLFTPNSRFDKFLRGDSNALTADEQEGYQLFKAYGCVSCHQGMNVGGNMFQRFGVIGDYFADRGNITSADLGRFNVTQNPDDRHVFRVPSLRNVALTAPYFHDGSAETLEEAIAIMAKYQLGRPLAKEQSDRIAQFLRTLTGEYQGKPLERSSQ
jgi:cytochrome c peroxidase